MSNSERLAEVLYRRDKFSEGVLIYAGWWTALPERDRERYLSDAAALLASDALAQMLAEARASALREAADDYERMYQQPGSATGADWLRRRAALTERTSDDRP